MRANEIQGVSMHAYVTECERPLAATTPLLIDKKDIGLFISPVLEGSSFCMTPAGTDWQLRFFVDSAFEQRMTVRFDGNEPNAILARACWLDNRNRAASNGDLIDAASQFIRNSGTLTLDRSRELTANRSLIADRDGFAYFSFDQHQFKRILLCYTLAIAYARVFRHCGIELMRSIRDNDPAATIRLRAQVLRFNAAYHTSLPVQSHLHELRAAWDVISAHFQLQELNQELTSQLSDVAAYLDEQQEREERVRRERAASESAARKEHLEAEEKLERKAREEQERRDKHNANKLSLLAIVLTATSLLSLAQLSPDQFFGNMRAWQGWWAALLTSW